jgi:hypothetical protein
LSRPADLWKKTARPPLPDFPKRFVRQQFAGSVQKPAF